MGGSQDNLRADRDSQALYSHISVPHPFPRPFWIYFSLKDGIPISTPSSPLWTPPLSYLFSTDNLSGQRAGSELWQQTEGQRGIGRKAMFPSSSHTPNW